MTVDQIECGGKFALIGLGDTGSAPRSSWLSLPLHLPFPRRDWGQFGHPLPERDKAEKRMATRRYPAENYFKRSPASCLSRLITRDLTRRTAFSVIPSSRATCAAGRPSRA
jgi:hypothetical protein